MKAKFINEALSDYLYGPSKEEIDKKLRENDKALEQYFERELGALDVHVFHRDEKDMHVYGKTDLFLDSLIEQTFELDFEVDAKIHWKLYVNFDEKYMSYKYHIIPDDQELPEQLFDDKIVKKFEDEKISYDEIIQKVIECEDEFYNDKEIKEELTDKLSLFLQ